MSAHEHTPDDAALLEWAASLLDDFDYRDCDEVGCGGCGAGNTSAHFKAQQDAVQGAARLREMAARTIPPASAPDDAAALVDALEMLLAQYGNAVAAAEVARTLVDMGATRATLDARLATAEEKREAIVSTITTALAAARAREDRFKRLLGGAYVRFPMPSDEPVQYVGVHPVRWGKVDEPTAGFREIDVDALEVAP